MSTEQVGEVIMRARAVPGRPGPNDIELLVAQNRRPAPTITGVVLQAMTPAGPASWTVVPDADGAAVISDVELPEGANALSLTVSRAGRPDLSGTAQVTTTPLAYHHPTIVSSAPIRDLLRGIALAVALAGVALALVTRRRTAVTDLTVQTDLQTDLQTGANRPAARV